MRVRPSPRLRALLRRRNARGATVFLVVLAMTLLTMMGIFAARAASLSELIVGYERSNQQTRYVLEAGVTMAAAQISAQPDLAVKFARSASNGTNVCYGGSWFPTIPGYTYACLPFNELSIANGSAASQTSAGIKTPAPPFAPVTDASGGLPDLNNADNNTPGSLGPAPVVPRFYAELTDIGPTGRPVAGMNAAPVGGAKFVYYQGTIGAWGQVGPWMQANTCTPDDQTKALTTARETGRGYVVFGPVSGG